MLETFLSTLHWLMKTAQSFEQSPEYKYLISDLRNLPSHQPVRNMESQVSWVCWVLKTSRRLSLLWADIFFFLWVCVSHRTWRGCRLRWQSLKENERLFLPAAIPLLFFLWFIVWGKGIPALTHCTGQLEQSAPLPGVPLVPFGRQDPDLERKPQLGDLPLIGSRGCQSSSRISFQIVIGCLPLPLYFSHSQIESAMPVICKPSSFVDGTKPSELRFHLRPDSIARPWLSLTIWQLASQREKARWRSAVMKARALPSGTDAVNLNGSLPTDLNDSDRIRGHVVNQRMDYLVVWM